MSLAIDQEFKSLIPPLSVDERAQLEANILADGCRDPLVVWGGVLIDGHNRYEICTKHELPFKTVEKEFESRAHACIWMLDNQDGRRNLPVAWKIENGLRKKGYLADIGRANRSELKVGNQNASKNIVVKNDNDVPKHNTRTEIAKAAGVSTGKVAQAEIVKRKAPELWERAKAEEITISAAYNEVKSKEKKAARTEMIEQQRRDIESGVSSLPEGVFEVVAMDPPWNYGRAYDPDGSRVANPYPEMTQAELLEMAPPFAKDSVLFLWTTHQFIWDAKQLMDRWGFTYKANVVWDKEKIGMGAWVRMQCEFCLVGIKGKPTWDNTTWRDIIREARREHSRKPDAFYRMVEEVTVGRRLEFFSREQRKGWEVFGNDTAKF